MNNEILKQIEHQFQNRVTSARRQGKKLKPGSVAYNNMQTEFFTGAMAAMVAISDQSFSDIQKIFEDANAKSAFRSDKASEDLHAKAMPPRWIFSIMRGDDIINIK